MNKAKDYIACCGAFCKTCKPYIEGYCKGCKLGYNTGARDINKVKCKIKICCLREKKLESCAECKKFSNCGIFNGRFKVGTHDHKKYQEALSFIMKKGYSKFLFKTKNWKNSTGKLD